MSNPNDEALTQAQTAVKAAAADVELKLYHWGRTADQHIFTNSLKNNASLVLRETVAAESAAFKALCALEEAVFKYTEKRPSSAATSAPDVGEVLRSIPAKVVLRKKVSYPDLLQARRSRSVFLGNRIDNNYTTEIRTKIPGMVSGVAHFSDAIVLNSNGVYVAVGDVASGNKDTILFAPDSPVAHSARAVAAEFKKIGLNPAELTVAPGKVGYFDPEGNLIEPSAPTPQPAKKSSPAPAANQPAPAATQSSQPAAKSTNAPAASNPAAPADAINAAFASTVGSEEEVGEPTESFDSLQNPSTGAPSEQVAETAKPAPTAAKTEEKTQAVSQEKPQPDKPVSIEATKLNMGQTTGAAAGFTRIRVHKGVEIMLTEKSPMVRLGRAVVFVSDITYAALCSLQEKSPDDAMCVDSGTIGMGAVFEIDSITLGKEVIDIKGMIAQSIKETGIPKHENPHVKGAERLVNGVAAVAPTLETDTLPPKPKAPQSPSVEQEVVGEQAHDVTVNAEPAASGEEHAKPPVEDASPVAQTESTPSDEEHRPPVSEIADGANTQAAPGHVDLGDDRTQGMSPFADTLQSMLDPEKAKPAKPVTPEMP